MTRNDLIKTIQEMPLAQADNGDMVERMTFRHGAIAERQNILAILKGLPEPEPQAATGEIATGWESEWHEMEVRG